MEGACAIIAPLLYALPDRSEMTLAPVRALSLEEMQQARQRIAPWIVRTPLVRLDTGKDGPDIRLKLENLQTTNSYKLRGALNAVASLDEAQRRRGVWTISAGNAGQGIAYAAGRVGVPCTVVAIETAPTAKLDRMRALGAKLVPVSYTDAWKALDERRYAGVEGTFIHPFDDDAFIAGHSSLAFEILEDAPEVNTVVAAVGGGGLLTAVGSAIKALKPQIKVLGVEPVTGSPLARSLDKGSPQPFPEWEASFVDGAGGKGVFPRMWDRLRPVIDGSVVVSLEETRLAMREIAEKARVIAEGAGSLSLAAARSGKAGDGTIVCVVSGGNIDLSKFVSLMGD